MKKSSFLLSLLAVILALTTLFISMGESSDLVYVDVNKLLEGYKRTKVVRTEFEAKAKN